ncbi:Gfo/Idh/MocA family protein [Arthrobacter sp. C152]
MRATQLTPLDDAGTACPDLRLGVVGYGGGGRRFHTPFIDAAAGISLAGVVARSETRRSHATSDWPGVTVHRSLTELLAAGVDAVTITTPPETHCDLALEAIAAGVDVIVDKPFAPFAAIGAELTKAAEAAGVLLSVYHNRRWDGDIRTAAEIVSQERLGDVWRVHSRFELDEAASLQPGAANGLLLDLGSHLVDQLIWLLGPVTAVTAHLNTVTLENGPTDAGFTLDLVHSSGATSHAEASKANRVEGRELRIYGSEGSFRYADLDNTLLEAHGLGAADRGKAPRFGILSTAKGQEAIPVQENRWPDFYTAFAHAARTRSAPPAPACEALEVLKVLDAARESALQGHTIHCSLQA